MSSTDDRPIRVLPDVRVPMRDGVSLSARIYLPPTDGPAPTLLRYTPYLNDGFNMGLNDVAQRFFAAHGFACVSVDIRGYGESDGLMPIAFSDQEALDGFDALEWAARQPWSTGRTGIWGVSYGGNTALSIAALRPPSLKAIVPIHAIDTEFTGAGWPHGCRGALVGEVDWGPRMIGTQLLPPLRFGEGWQERWRSRIDALDMPFPFAWHTVPPETWTAWTTDIAAIDVPTLAVSGWHDSYPRETVDYHGRLNVQKRLVLGPWKHEFPDFAAHDRIGFLDVAARWFYHWLGDGSAPLPDLAPVTFFEGPGPASRGWRSAAAWPPPDVEIRTFYPDGQQQLSEKQPGSTRALCLVDPTVGLAALPWDWTTPTPIGVRPPDISPDDHRTTTWTTPPLEEDLLITGNPVVVVHLAANRPDVPLRAWLSHVEDRTGFSTLISQGWVRPTQLTGRPLSMDGYDEVRVPLAPTSYRLHRGARLRLALAGSHFPALVPAPDPAALVFEIGPEATRLELPVEAGGATTGPTPSWPPSHVGTPATQLESTGHQAVERALDDSHASYRQSRRARFALEAGGELDWNLRSSAWVARDHPGAVRLESDQVWRVVGGPAALVIRVHTEQTFDEQQVHAEIDVDGERFFERDWSLRFDSYPWRIQR